MSTSNINNGVSFRALCIDTYGNKEYIDALTSLTNDY